MNRATRITSFSFLLLAFGYVLIRGLTVGLTHDEALTYKIIQGDEMLQGTANHHWLNTQLSSVATSLFGEKEFALRLPNILSFAVFGFFLFRIAKSFLLSSFMQLALILLLCGNPFILDFFSLSRGYGLSIAFVTASLFYLFKVVELKAGATSGHFFLAGIFAGLALSANLNTLNYFLVLYALIFLCGFVFKPKSWILSFTGLLVTGGIILYFSIDRLFFLKEKQELYFGTGDLNASIDNLIYSGFYDIDGFEQVHLLRYLLFTVLLVAGVIIIRKRKLFTPGASTFIILVAIFCALIAEHVLFEALYPINRSSLYIYPILVLAILLNFDQLTFKMVRPFIATCSLVYIFLNLSSYNLEKTMTWAEDADLRKTMLLLKNDIGENSEKVVECKWIYEPILNYYRSEYQVPIRQLFREDLKYQGDYIFTNSFDGDDPGLLINYRQIFIGNESGLKIYKRKATAAN